MSLYIYIERTWKWTTTCHMVVEEDSLPAFIQLVYSRGMSLKREEKTNDRPSLGYNTVIGENLFSTNSY